MINLKSSLRVWQGIALVVVAAPLAVWGLEASLGSAGQANAQIEQPGACAQADTGSTQIRRLTTPQATKPMAQPAKLECRPSNISAM
jgi:hypothetical protein